MEDENLQKQNLQEDGTETETPGVPEQNQEETSTPTVSDELTTEILTEIKAGNEILGRMYALEVFILAFMIFLFVYLIIKNNVTRHY